VLEMSENEEGRFEEMEEQEGAQGEERALIAPEKLEAVERERDEYLELARRGRADYINLQRRMETQSEAIRDAARHEFAKDMIGVLDDLELAIKHAGEGESEEVAKLVEGLELTRSKFLATLAKYGIRPIEAEGTPFDHNLHEAIAQVPVEDAAPGTVYRVAQTGYTANGKMLRAARVIVAAEPRKKDEG
jgi:molecular chaperone GrpE